MNPKYCIFAGPGIYFGNIDVTGMAGETSVTVDTKLMEYPCHNVYVGGYIVGGYIIYV